MKVRCSFFFLNGFLFFLILFDTAGFKWKKTKQTKKPHTQQDQGEPANVTKGQYVGQTNPVWHRRSSPHTATLTLSNTSRNYVLSKSEAENMTSGATWSSKKQG